MNISRNWIADYVDFSELSNAEFEELITTRVAEVDEIRYAATPLDFAVVGKIIHVEDHPTNEKLLVAEVDTRLEVQTVVCGAKNCREGAIVAHIPKDGEIYTLKSENHREVVQDREIAGVKSYGVLASEAELGLSTKHDGLLLFDEETFEVGKFLSDYLDGSDYILEIDNKSLTHRPDLWSHYGFAREIAAILNKPLMNRPDMWADNTEKGRNFIASLGEEKSEYKVEIEKNVPCGRFMAVELSNVSVYESPLWLKKRLHCVGVGTKNVLVDLSNYVMLDIGQPNHVYDSDNLKGKTIKVRRARPAESFLALDDVEYELDANDLVVADKDGVVALAGVMGGKESSVDDDTVNILLESANFDPTAVRLATKRHGLRTDSSNRFEKSLSAYSVPVAIHRYTELLMDIDKDCDFNGRITEVFNEKPKDISIECDFDYIRERLGADIDDERVSEILTGLGFVLTKEGEKYRVDVPFFRATRDISIVDDLVEEIGRIYGYENVPESIPQIQSVATPQVEIKKLISEIKDCLAAMGFSECDSYSFQDNEKSKELGFDEEAIELENAIDASEKHLRTSLIPAMLKSVKTNHKLFDNFALFEIARTYHTKAPKSHGILKKKKSYPNSACYEKQMLSLAYQSGITEKKLASSQKPDLPTGGDFFSLLTAVKRLVKLASQEEVVVSAISSAETKAWMHPHRAARLILNGVCIAEIAEVSPVALDASKRVVISEIDLDLLLEVAAKQNRYHPIVKYPDSFFEMSVVMPEREHFSKLENMIRTSVSEDLLNNIEVLSVYSGKPLAEGEKSVSVKLSLGCDFKTLSADELQEIQDALITAVNKSAYSLRS